MQFPKTAVNLLQRIFANMVRYCNYISFHRRLPLLKEIPNKKKGEGVMGILSNPYPINLRPFPQVGIKAPLKCGLFGGQPRCLVYKRGREEGSGRRPSRFLR
ncbi:hypothetical protein TNIN_396461 [Trichonephila inaurata madagascariensis]|uniref:Uncharacterized protein n=1 Tax=Trichonephila inaurata madagascariensis TaxID=2747483 RepID=A0A8X6XY47_9ARAC|nr:hypothetical protein TNIN_396461 [Trichonephila inaurata madagascariensis]